MFGIITRIANLFHEPEIDIAINSIWTTRGDQDNPWHVGSVMVVVTEVKNGYVRYSYYDKINLEVFDDSSIPIEIFIRVFHNTGLFIS
jgi:hypothetical protein